MFPKFEVAMTERGNLKFEVAMTERGNLKFEVAMTERCNFQVCFLFPGIRSASRFDRSKIHE
jgi:hypothetical protein